MSSKPKAAVKRASIAVGVLATLLIGAAYVRTLTAIDPFAGIKQVTKSLDRSLGVRAENVRIESWDGEKPMVRADVARIDVRSDKQRYDLFDIENGRFFGKRGEMGFTAQNAVWNVPARELSVPSGARLTTKDIDVKAPRLAFHSETRIVNVPGHVVGRAYGGVLDAAAMQYNVDTGKLTAGPVDWKGPIALELQGKSAQKPREWTISGKSMSVDGDVSHYQAGRAADDSMIVMADDIEWNRKTNLVTATGHVKYFSAKADLICEKAVIDRNAKIATLTGNVLTLIKAKDKQTTISAKDAIPDYHPIPADQIAKSGDRPPLPQDKEARKKLDEQIRSTKNVRDYPTVCYSEKVVYWYKEGERHAEISGHPQARQVFPDGNWRQIWTNMAYYNGETERLKLVSSDGKKDTRMINSLGDDAVATSLDVSTKDGDESMTGQAIEGRFADYSDEIPRENPPPKTGPPKTTGGGGR